MTLSLLMPTNRASVPALSKVLHVASLASADIEVVIADNSGDDAKRRLLAGLRSDTVKVVSTEPTAPRVNAQRVLDESSGKWIQFIADDDYLIESGLRKLASFAEAIEDGSGVVAATGGFFVESPNGVSSLRYAGLDAPRGLDRLRAFVSTAAPNLLYYGALRRDFVELSLVLQGQLPFNLSYHDQVISALMLAVGKVLPVPQYVYLYDLGGWSTRNGSRAIDRGYQQRAGLPLSTDLLQWLMCGAEGASLLASATFQELVGDEGPLMAALWLEHNHHRFRHDNRSEGLQACPWLPQARALHAKWDRKARLESGELLDDVAAFLREAGVEQADAYHQFWSGL
ncbi:MAG: glycosyltransferase [Burkholderiaceae bacterium]|nr:glycosyltransferase [Burkholderiaceae bacterium]